MENLTKQQIVLVTLLVSFVTSIATGIVTVSLMEQAPPAITQTINRVVEKTIERVVQVPNQASVVTKETVVVKADDLVVSAVENNSKSIVRIIEVLGEGEYREESVVAMGVVVSKDGLIVSDIVALTKKYYEGGNMIPKSYLALTPDGKKFSVAPVGVDEERGLVFMRAFEADNIKILSALPPIVFGGVDALKLGQALVLIGGAESNSVSTGIISGLEERLPPAQAVSSNVSTSTVAVPEPKKVIYSIKTDFRPADSLFGSILVNLNGQVIGLNLSKSPSRGVYVPSNFVANSIANFRATEGKKI